MPRLSDTMESGTVAKWCKQVGEPVKKGEVIAEIETDKANMELESYSNGILAKIIVEEGQSAQLGQPIALVADSEEEAKQLRNGSKGVGADQRTPAAPAESSQPSPPDAPGPEGATTEPQTQQAQTAETPPDGRAQTPSPETAAVPDHDADEAETAEAAETQGRVKASPLARRMALEHDIDLTRMSGTGPGGRITKDDVQAYLQHGAQAAAPSAGPTGAAAPASAPEKQPSPPGVGRAPQPIEMTRMQQTIARRMTEARFSAPDFVLTAEIDMTDAVALLSSISTADEAPKVGPNDLLIKAVAIALKRHPEVNAGWEGGTIVRFGRINVGNAVAIEGGLVVPVIQDADKKTLGQIADESKSLVEKARNGKLAPSDYEHGTFSISNLGMYGIDQFTAVINVPEACIMGVGAIAPKPVVRDEQVVVRDRMRLTLSCDHRVVNGTQGAEFLRTLRELLENPVLALL
jgi:pyruvate dehydrogenase E2 component (dihydrolipoamide acetyltransferase)